MPKIVEPVPDLHSTEIGSKQHRATCHGVAPIGLKAYLDPLPVPTQHGAGGTAERRLVRARRARLSLHARLAHTARQGRKTRQPGGSSFTFSLSGNWDAADHRNNMFEMEWPPIGRSVRRPRRVV